MNSLTWHIVKKDFRRLWLVVAFWWFLLAVQATLPAANFDHGVVMAKGLDDFAFRISVPPSDSFSEMQDRVIELLPFLDFWMVVFIAASVVKADSPSNDKAYWRTQPVSGAQMLGAKVMFLALFCVVVPTLFSLGVQAYYGIPAADWPKGLGAYVLHLIILVSAAAALATLFRHPLFTAVGILIISLLVQFCVRVDISFKLWLDLSEAAQNYRNHAAMWCVLGTMVTVFCFMYVFRKRKSGVILLAAGLALAQSAEFLWPYHNATPPSVPVAAPGLSLVQDATYIGYRDDFPSNPMAGSIYLSQEAGSNYNALLGRLQGDLPAQPNEVWRLNHVESTLAWPDGSRVNSSLSSQIGTGIWLFRNSAPVLQSLGLGVLLPEDSHTSPAQMAIADLTKKGLQKLDASAAHWAGNLYYDAGRLVPVTDLPLSPGITQRKNGEFISIGGYGAGRNDAYVHTVQQKLESADWLTQLGFADFSANPDDYYLLWNPKRGELIGSENDGNYPNSPLVGNGLVMATGEQSLDFVFYAGVTNGHSSYHDKAYIQAWLAGAHLICLRFVPEHHYVISAKIDPFYSPKALTQAQPPSSVPSTVRVPGNNTPTPLVP